MRFSTRDLSTGRPVAVTTAATDRPSPRDGARRGTETPVMVITGEVTSRVAPTAAELSALRLERDQR